MATKLAIGYLVNGGGDRPPAASTFHRAVNDPLADRPRIPRVVIDWPVGAGDPATDVAGPAAFRATASHRPLALPTAVFEAMVLAVLFAGFVAAIFVRLGPSLDNILAANAQQQAAAYGGRKLATVDTRILSLVPAERPELVAQRTVQ